jgi:hypothetical protein
LPGSHSDEQRVKLTAGAKSITMGRSGRSRTIARELPQGNENGGLQ